MSFPPPSVTVRRATRLRDRVGRAVFGDRAGLVLFLGCLCFVALYWRAGVFITDNVTLREGLRALADGHLWIEPATGDYLSTPGTSVHEGFVYGRNYGQLFLSLPALWGLQALASVADLHVALVAVWHLLALAFVVHLGHVVGRRRAVALGGSGLVFASFLVNVVLASQFVSVSLPLLALQTTAAIAAGFVAVALYRAIALKRSRRVGLFAGAAVVVAMPVGFWATIPKRHVFATLVCVEVLYLFSRSRDDPGVAVPGLGTVPAYRALAYASAGLLTWDHAAAGLFVFLALVVVDVPTAPSNDARTLGVVGAVFALSLLPTFATNYLIAGDPFRPPRVLYGAGVEVSVDGGGVGESVGTGSGGGTGSAGSAGGDATSTGPVAGWWPFVVLGEVVATVTTTVRTHWLTSKLVWLFVQTNALLQQGLHGLARLDELSRTFLHSSVEGIDQGQRFLGVNLAMLEAAPLLGAATVVVRHTVPARARQLRRRVDATDVLALLLVAAFVVLYNNRLPLNTTITVRYLLPLYPLGAYLIARSTPVSHLIDEHLPAVLWSYAGGVLLGGQLLLAVLVVERYAVAEAVRAHATLGFVLGGALAVLAATSVLDERFDSPAAVALGLAGAGGTVFLLLSGLHYFSFVGEYVLPVSGALSDVLAAAG